MEELKKIKRLLHGLAFIFIMSAIFVGGTETAAATDTITVTLQSATGTYQKSVATYIDSAITVTCTSNLTGGTVNINGFVSGDALTFTNSTTVTGSYNSSNGVLTIFGTASASDYQTFLRSVKFNTSSSSGTRTIEIVLSNTSGNVMFYGGHYYEYVSTTRTWTAAKVAAEAMAYSGVSGNGYLATITTADENAFISQKLGNDAWIGGSDEANEGQWRWMGGPESGHLMSEYTTNWASGEPNDSSGEDYAEIYVATGKWNDLNGTSPYGYVVEYGHTTYTLAGGSGSASKVITIITKFTPTYTTPTGITATYGAILSNVALPSGFSWEENTSTAVGNVGDRSHTVKYTPTDLATYSEVTGISVTIHVNKAIPAVNTPVSSDITYGPAKKLSDVSLPSGWSWDSPNTVPTVGNSGYAVTYTPTDTSNYDYTGISGWNSGTSKVNRTASLTVDKAIPIVSTPTLDAVTYNPILTLSAIALPSGWTWDNTSSVPAVTNSGYALTYSPSDILNYEYTGITGWNSETEKVNRIASLTVNKANPVVTWPTIGGITYGGEFQTAVGTNGISDVSGDFVIEDALTIPEVTGSPYSKNLYFEPAGLESYNTLSTPAAITVIKAEADITDIICADKKYDGTPLSPSAIITLGTGTILYTYSGTDIIDSTTNSPSAPGIYSITATLPSSTNYNEAVKTKTGVVIWRKSNNIEKEVEIVVNGQIQSAEQTTSTNSEGQSVITVTLDSENLNLILKENNDNPNIVIPITGESEVAVGVVSGEIIKTMEEKGGTLEVKTETGSYTIPADEINIDVILEEFGHSVALSDIDINISIARAPQETVKVVENAAQMEGFVIVVPAMDFSITCTYEGKTVEVKHFNNFVERTVAIPDGVDPSKITTGIVVEQDGTVRHVPTVIIEIDGKYYAKINSLTNSTYSVIWNPLEFKDAENRWAKEAINDMGSRMIVSGMENGLYELDRDITRAEFAAIMVKALGLKPISDNNIFTDVKDSAWYCKYINAAAEYKIISGYKNGKFEPMAKVTREQAMTMISNAMNITGLKVEFEEGEADKLLSEFSDAGQSGGWAKNDIATCLKTDIVSGKSTITLAPKDNITRAEVAAIVRKLLQKSNLI